MTTRSIASLCALLCALTVAAPARARPADGTLIARPGALLGRVTALRGTLAPGAAGRPVALQRQQADGTWRRVASAHATAAGTFVAHWRADALGPATVRALPAGTSAQAASPALTATLTVYRPARATWYGPGFYGRRTACGETMSHALLGVAHRTLPCGTPVAIYHRGRAITVPVIDRGPFANGAHYDLTSAAARAVGMTGTSTIGVIPRRGARTDAPAATAPAPGGDATGGTPAG